MFLISQSISPAPLHHMLFCCVHNRSQFSPRPSAHHSQPMLLSKIGLFAPTLIYPGISLTYDQKMITPISHIILKSEKRNEFDDKKDGGEGSDLKQTRNKSGRKYKLINLIFLSPPVTVIFHLVFVFCPLDNAPPFDPRTSEYPILLFCIKCLFFPVSSAANPTNFYVYLSISISLHQHVFFCALKEI